MPAVTADPTTLPVVGPLPMDAVDRPVRSVTTAIGGFEGEGFPVRRAFAGVPRQVLDPFIHMDQMGEVDYAPGEPRGTDWHPHRGFETVTYIIDGEFLHQDSHGGGGSITNGATQWMTAGAGILHIETPPEDLVVRGGLFHGLQLWVNLPAAQKWVDPRYQNLAPEAVQLLTSSDATSVIRLIAGKLAGHTGPGSTRTPVTVAHATIAPDARLHLPWPEDFNALAYVLSGRGSAGVDAVAVEGGQLVVYGSGDAITLTAAQGDRPLDVYLLGGQPIGEPVAQYGPFVMNTRAELQQAVDDFNAGRLGTVPAGALRPFHRR